MTESESKIKEVISRTYNVKSFRVDVGPVADFQAGQFLSVTLKAEKELKKYLSISNSPTEKGYIEFTKKITTSEFSQTLNNLKPGDSVKVQYPYGKFILDEKAPKIAFLSGGIGIAPIRSMCQYAVDKKLTNKITLFYGNKSIDDIAFCDELDMLQRRGPNFKVVHVLMDPTDRIPCKSGLINQQMIKKCLPDYNRQKFYVCGPPAMVAAMEKILTDGLCVSRSNIVTENFQGY